ncbi:MAG TPA: GAF domain-containing sensor histidine kinase [Anaerolineae bacterium]|nr:GAF domain-containing sensor histidine kinase [Anaerolineae bacterium]
MDTISTNISQKRLARLVEVSRSLNSPNDLDTLLRRIVSEANDLVDTEVSSILLLDPYTRELRFRATSDTSQASLGNFLVPLDNSIAGTVLLKGEPIISEDVSTDDRWNPEVATSINFKTSTMLAVPMYDDESNPVGVIEAINKTDGSRFTPSDVETLSAMASLAGIAISKARLIGELRAATAKLSELDKLKSDFLAVVSHELRTPLAMIVGYAALLREDAEMDEDASLQLDSVMSAALHLRDLIQDIFNMKYVDTGNSQLNLSNFDIRNVVTQITTDRQDMADAKRQTVHLSAPSQPVIIEADRNMVDVVLGNLFNNAVKFTPDGGEIFVSIEQKGNEIWLSVRDTGIGIPEEKLEQVFDRFYQIEDHLTRSFAGMGLGLAIARELVIQHRGRIWAKSEPGNGCEFHVALPKKQTDVQPE